MSSFRQLMMKRFHNEANYMDLTVVGSPTITDGVVSGFSANNYLTLPTNFAFGDDFEIQFKFTTGAFTSSIQTLFNFRTDSGVGDTERICMNVSNGTDCNTIFRTTSNTSIVNDVNNVFSSNTTYYIRFVYKNSYITALLSTDSVNWNTVLSGAIAISGTFALETSRWIGNSNINQTSRYFRGSIDLNQDSSYIIKKEQKYIFTV